MVNCGVQNLSEETSWCSAFVNGCLWKCKPVLPSLPVLKKIVGIQISI